MTTSNTREACTINDALRATVSTRLYDAFSADDGSLSRLDRWTQRRVSDQNLAKLELVLEADDPVEHCYQNLIREIDTEAQTGIYLVRPDAASPSLRKLAAEPGVSGTLHRDLEAVASRLFIDALAHSNDDLDLVWVTIEARYDRAHIDAEVSQDIMRFLLDDADRADAIAGSLRSLMYAFHDDMTRHFCELPMLRDRRKLRSLAAMIVDLKNRADDYDRRVAAIVERADA